MIGHTKKKCGKLIGVGVGPGDPDYLTLGAVKALQSADIVIAPCADGIVSRAESIVLKVLPEVQIKRVEVPMRGGNAFLKLNEIVEECLRKCMVVGFITLGDPSIYSTFSNLLNLATSIGAEIEVVPGITAFQSLASKALVTIADNDEKIRLVTALSDISAVREAAKDYSSSIIIYKCGKFIREIIEILRELGRLDDAVFGEFLGQPNERVCMLYEVKDEMTSYLACIILPAKRRTM